MTVSRINLTANGPSFSRIVHGLWRLADWRKSRGEILKLINSCIEIGITTFDHADIYGEYTCEGLFGNALTESPHLREKIELVTKCGIKLISKNRPEYLIKHYDTSKTHIIRSVENSLRNLRTDYIDLLLIHRPDPLMNADEVAEAFSALKQSGKVLNFGVSNFLPFQFELLASRLDFPLVTNQIEFSVLEMSAQNNGIIDLCQKLQIAPMAWSPFGGGRLFTEDSRQIVRLREVLKKIGESLNGASIDQIALAWLLTHPVNFLPVLGTGRFDRIERAVETEKIKLTREKWFMIWSAFTGTEVP